ncbi:MAG: hypothetical protein OXR66_01675 [Candidatus Woesearchaeota archaeon]|nr:hypothetical protein [Candidatus Woesearchaeota archaeon]
MRKGQLTIFIILGLAVLLILGLFMLNSQKTPQTFQAQQETTAVTNIVQQCLSTVGKTAVQTISMNGGYDKQTLTYRPDHESAVIKLDPQHIPLWHEIHACNDGLCLGDHRPRLCKRGEQCPLSTDVSSDVSFQESIEQYIERELPDCVQQLEQLPSMDVTITDKPRVHAMIRETDILLTLTYPMESTTQDGQLLEAEHFTTVLPVNLAQAYELATKLYALERNTNFLEEVFLQLIAAYSGADRHLPPIRALQTGGTPQYWVTRNVQQTIEDDLLPFMHFIQVVNAENYVPLTSPGTQQQAYAAGIYDYMAIKLDNTPYPVRVTFEYPYSGMYLDISGKEFLKPRELPGADFLSIIGGMRFLEYKFKYAAAYPLIVKVEDPYAFNGDGLEVHFGLEVNIMNNYPVNTSTEILTFTAADTTLDLVSPEQLVDHLYTVRVLDLHTGLPVPEAGVGYTCGTHYQMGITDTRGIWRGKLPYCLGGAITVEHVAYMNTGVAQENTVEDHEQTDIELGMWPRHAKPVELYKYADGTRQQLAAHDNVILTLTRQRTTPYDGVVPFSGILEYGSTDADVAVNTTMTVLEEALNDGTITQAEYDDAVATTRTHATEENAQQQVLDLVPGRYDYQAFLTYYGLIQIPAQEECSGGIINKCITLNATNFTHWMSGGGVLIDEDGFTLTEEFVYSDRPLILHVLEQPLPRTWDDIQQQQDLESYQTYERKQQVQPQT